MTEWIPLTTLLIIASLNVIVLRMNRVGWSGRIFHQIIQVSKWNGKIRQRRINARTYPQYVVVGKYNIFLFCVVPRIIKAASRNYGGRERIRWCYREIRKKTCYSFSLFFSVRVIVSGTLRHTHTANGNNKRTYIYYCINERECAFYSLYCISIKNVLRYD